jgi:hypothetical protein
MTVTSVLCAIVCIVTLVLARRERRLAWEIRQNVFMLASKVATTHAGLLMSDETTALALPYRTAATVDTPPLQETKPSIQGVFAWHAEGRIGSNESKKNGATPRPAFDCPHCNRAWWMRERLCECSDCDGGHFHLVCGGELHKDQSGQGACGAKWIMRSKEASKMKKEPPKDDVVKRDD